MAVIRPTDNDVIVTTSLEKSKPPEYDEKKPRDVFKNTVESPEDLLSVEHPVVTHDVVEVSDHVETADDMDNATAKGDSMDAISDVPLGGVGFVASIGLGGGGGGKFGHRSGGGKRRLVARGGGSKATESAVDAALRWLAAHQEADGHWDAKKYGGNQDTARSNSDTDVGVTGMALLAFLGAGHTEKVGQYKDNVRRAVAWLKSIQTADGRIARVERCGYSHAIAGMGLAEAAGMANIADTKAAAQKAIDYSTKIHQSGQGYEKMGWRYTKKSAGDLSVTGWFVMQLKSAKVAGLSVDHGSFEGAIRFLDACEKKGEGGDKGYGPASVYQYTPNQGHGNGVRVTAIGNLCRQFLGWKKEDLQASVQWFMDKGGVPDGWGAGKTDLYYWYYGTLCVFQQGGDMWKQWNEAMKKTLCESQRRGGDEDGSWDPVGQYADRWGRVGQTAIGALCLEVYYRYLPMYKN